MSNSDCFVSVIAPVYNDSDIVESFVEEVTTTLSNNFENYELILVDDGSKDNTVQKITAMLSERECIRLIQLSRTFGQEIAISAGLDSVIGDFVVVMLPDTDPPDLIPKMVEQSSEGAGIVFGIRKHRRTDPLLFRVGVCLFYWYCNQVLKLNVPKNTTHFRVLSRQAVNALCQIKDRMRYLHTLSAHVGYTNQSFVYEILRRRERPRTKSFWKAVHLAVSIIVANSIQPLRLVSWLGFAISALNALYVGYIVLIYLLKEQVVEGWVTSSLQSSVTFFFLFLILAVLCEYVGQLLAEVKGRPLYYVMEEQNSSVMVAKEERKNVVMKSVSHVADERWHQDT